MTAVRSLTFEALGGEVELFAIEPAERLDATAEWIRRLHDQLTRFEPDSELSRFNARAGEWVEVSPALEALLGAALYSYEESNGLVNIAILPALVAAGYDRTFEEIDPRGGRSLEDVRVFFDQKGVDPHRIGGNTDPIGVSSHLIGQQRRAADAEHQVPEGRNALGMTRATPVSPIASLPDLLKVVPGRALLAKGAALDLGGIAKGWIADRAVERLGPNSLVSCGGDLHARGGGETGKGWPVGFGDRTLLLKDMAAATSGTSKRRWGDGKHHLIDPRTGVPSTSDLSEVSVLADTALDAEVFAKTAFLLGSEDAEGYLKPRSMGWALS